MTLSPSAYKYRGSAGGKEDRKGEVGKIFFEREREEKPRERPTVFKEEKRDRKRGNNSFFLERKE